jgi:tetratricopeptide (TPR) repeat protein
MQNIKRLDFLRKITLFYKEKQEYKKALPFYEEAVQISNFQFEIVKEYAWLLQKLNLHKKAIKIYKKLLSQEQDPELYLNIAYGYRKLNKYKKAKNIMIY